MALANLTACSPMAALETIDRVKKLNNLTQTGNRLSEETQNQILALKAKHDMDKLNFEHRILDL